MHTLYKYREVGRHAALYLGEGFELLEFLLQLRHALSGAGGEVGETVLQRLGMLEYARELGVVGGQQRFPCLLHALGCLGGPGLFFLLGFCRRLCLVFGSGLGGGFGQLFGVGLGGVLHLHGFIIVPGEGAGGQLGSYRGKTEKKR